MFWWKSIFVKFLTWFFLNLLLLGLILGIFFQIQFYVPPDSLLRLKPERETASLRYLIRHELTRAPREEWDGLLDRYGQAFKVKLFLFAPKGFPLAGEKVVLPPEVKEKLKNWRQYDFENRQGPRHSQPQSDSNHYRGRGKTHKNPQRGPPPQRFMRVHTHHPSRYWLGLPVPIMNRAGNGFVPAMLLAVTDSLFASGLYPNPMPWIIAALVVVAFSLLWWWPMVRHLTRPLKTITQATEEIARGHFRIQLKEQRADEIGRLGRSINSMAARLDSFIQGQKRFLSDVAHELCSPLSRLTMGLGVLEMKINESQLQGFRDVQEEAENISELVGEILTFSRAELRPEAIILEQMNLAEVVKRAMDREKIDHNHIHVNIDKNISVKANPDLLVRALTNVIRNAVRYGGKPGPVEISATISAETVILEVADTGPGIPPAYLERIFEPFFRLEPDRNRAHGGTGLGLAIVKTCIDACQGQVSARNRQPSGLVVVISLTPGPTTAT